MGLIHAEILLVNAEDVGLARRQIIGEEEIRQVNVNMLVDSGSYMMCINENIQEILNAPVIDKKRYRLAEGVSSVLNVVSSIRVKFRNNIITCDAIVLPGDSEPLLGAIPMKALDVLIDPLRQELICHSESPDYVLRRM